MFRPTWFCKKGGGSHPGVDGRDSPATRSAQPNPRQGYEDFLADIVGAAQKFGFKPEKSPGRDEPRLRGLRQ